MVRGFFICGNIHPWLASLGDSVFQNVVRQAPAAEVHDLNIAVTTIIPFTTVSLDVSFLVISVSILRKRNNRRRIRKTIKRKYCG